MSLENEFLSQSPTLSLESGDDLLIICVFIISILKKELGQPSQILHVTESFMKDDLLPICGYLRIDLDRYNREYSEIPKREVGLVIQSLKEIEPLIASWVQYTELGSKDKIDSRNIVYYSILDLMDKAFLQVEKYLPDQYRLIF